jgi:WD40 repeat protein
MRHDGEVLSAQFSADRQRVATASRDKTARVWDAPDDVLLLADLAEAACGSVLQTSGQTEILKLLPPGQVRAPGRKSLQSLGDNLRD